MNNKGFTQNISFSSGRYDLYQHAEAIAQEYFDDNISQAIMECIECHRAITRTHGNWRELDKQPMLADRIAARILEKLKDVAIVANGKDEEIAKEAIGKGLQLPEGELFE